VVARAHKEAELPEGLDAARHRDLRGRAQHPWWRRGGLAVFVAIGLAALLNVFGQESSSGTAAGQTGALTVRGPTHLRGGLLYQVRFTVESRGELKAPKLVLSPGWFDGLTMNTLEPSPSQEGSRNGSVVFSLQAMSPGERQVVWTQWQVNPTRIGSRRVHVDLYDGGTPIAQIRRTMTVYP
jgi:hypothetical protein